jgi:hypothetical protein
MVIDEPGVKPGSWSWSHVLVTALPIPLRRVC